MRRSGRRVDQSKIAVNSKGERYSISGKLMCKEAGSTLPRDLKIQGERNTVPNTCPHTAMSDGLCYFHGGKGPVKAARKLAVGRFRKAYRNENLREKYERHITDKRGTEQEEAIASVMTVIEVDTERLNNPVVCAQEARDAFDNLHEALYIELPKILARREEIRQRLNSEGKSEDVMIVIITDTQGQVHTEEEFQAFYKEAASEKEALMRAALISLDAALKGMEDYDKISEKITVNAERVSKMSLQQANRAYKLKQTVSLDLVGAFFALLEAAYDEFIPRERRNDFNERVDRILSGRERDIYINRQRLTA